jgi:hypothetical protein
MDEVFDLVRYETYEVPKFAVRLDFVYPTSNMPYEERTDYDGLCYDLFPLPYGCKVIKRMVP